MTDDMKKLGEPLTIEQLREMDDHAVKVVFLDCDCSEACTGVITMFDPNDSDNGVDVGCVFRCIKDYGKTWLAYRYPPARINREEWEPCEECKTCRNCKNYDDYDPYEGTTGECGQCYNMSNFEPVNFCHDCGKPLTEEARTMLEKRLRGVRTWRYGATAHCAGE